MHINTHYYTYHNPWGLSQICTCQSHGSPSAAQSSSTRPFLGRRLCTFCPSHPSSRSCGWLPVVRAGDRGTIPFGCSCGCSDGARRYNHVSTSTALNSAGGLGRLPYVLREFLRAGLVPRSLKLYEVLCDLLLCAITHDVLKLLFIICYYTWCSKKGSVYQWNKAFLRCSSHLVVKVVGSMGVGGRSSPSVDEGFCKDFF